MCYTVIDKYHKHRLHVDDTQYLLPSQTSLLNSRILYPHASVPPLPFFPTYTLDHPVCLLPPLPSPPRLAAALTWMLTTAFYLLPASPTATVAYCSTQQTVRPGKCKLDHDTSDLTCQSLTTSPGQEPKSLSNPQGVTYCSLTSSLITLSHSLIQGPTWTFYCQPHSHLALTPL